MSYVLRGNIPWWLKININVTFFNTTATKVTTHFGISNYFLAGKTEQNRLVLQVTFSQLQDFFVGFSNHCELPCVPNTIFRQIHREKSRFSSSSLPAVLRDVMLRQPQDVSKGGIKLER